MKKNFQSFNEEKKSFQNSQVEKCLETRKKIVDYTQKYILSIFLFKFYSVDLYGFTKFLAVCGGYFGFILYLCAVITKKVVTKKVVIWKTRLNSAQL